MTSIRFGPHRRWLTVAFVSGFGLLSVLHPAENSGPPATGAAEQKAAIARLQVMVGEWQGRGTIEMPQGRYEFHGGERVQLKIDGLALLIEGSFFHRDAEGREVPSHTTLGVISFDPRSRTYRFHSWLANGMSNAAELKLVPDGWQWEIVHPRGRMRYTTSFADGDWVEIGERTSDGTTWQPFFEMRLKRVAAR